MRENTAANAYTDRLTCDCSVAYDNPQ